jgi:hypothetical protein
MLGNVRKAMKRVRESPNLSPAQKAEQLQRLESVMGRTLAAGAAPAEVPAPQP